ncbi:MAG: hypothetical protein MZV64_10450 [Ignavibacteriales bacterium]|nr:hypothetical protein [Ignavibacteriales bacterium]
MAANLIFAALHGVILDAAEDFGFGSPTADRLAGQIERLMRQRLGGDVYYIPTPEQNRARLPDAGAVSARYQSPAPAVHFPSLRKSCATDRLR